MDVDRLQLATAQPPCTVSAGVMGQHVHWRHACAALAICMLLACTGCTGQDASADKQDAEASHTAGETPAAEGVTPVSKPKGGDAGEAAAAAAAASQASNHQTADGATVGKAAKARGKAAASVSGKSASRPQKGALKAGLRGKDLDAALKKVRLLCNHSAQLSATVDCDLLRSSARQQVVLYLNGHLGVCNPVLSPHCRQWMP